MQAARDASRTRCKPRMETLCNSRTPASAACAPRVTMAFAAFVSSGTIARP
eukprot:IDg16522t1